MTATLVWVATHEPYHENSMVYGAAVSRADAFLLAEGSMGQWAADRAGQWEKRGEDVWHLDVDDGYEYIEVRRIPLLPVKVGLR